MFGLSGLLGECFVEMIRKTFLAPRTVDDLAVVRGTAASWTIIFHVFWWKGCRDPFQREARGREALVELDTGDQEGLHVVDDGPNDGAVR